MEFDHSQLLLTLRRFSAKVWTITGHADTAWSMSQWALIVVAALAAAAGALALYFRTLPIAFLPLLMTAVPCLAVLALAGLTKWVRTNSTLVMIVVLIACLSPLMLWLLVPSNGSWAVLGQNNATSGVDQSIGGRESANNKYVCVSAVSKPWVGIGSHAILIEFGMKNLSSDGVGFEIKLNREAALMREFPGPPRRQQEFSFVSMSELDVPKLLEGSIGGYISNVSVNPDKSFYVYLEADKPIEPVDILFFAVPYNAQKLPSEAIKIGHAYMSCPD